MRRGFALPMVLLLALVVSLATAVMLRRQAALRLTIDRELRAYQEHHAARGLQEVISAWTRSLGDEPLDSVLGEDGQAFDLDLAGGSTARVSLFEAQGTVLINPQGLSGQSLEDARGIASRLPRRTRSDDTSLVRKVGPVAISINSAPEVVLGAVADFVFDGGTAADQFVRELLKKRAEGPLERNMLSQLAIKVKADNAQRLMLTRLLTVKPTLWYVVVELYSPRTAHRPSMLKARYGGALIIDTGRGPQAESAEIWDRSAPFLSWEDLGVDDQRGGL